MTGIGILKNLSLSGFFKIVGTVYGLRAGQHVVHINANGNLGNACSAAGAIYNPTDMIANIPAASNGTGNSNYGDLGTIVSAVRISLNRIFGMEELKLA